MWMMTVLACSIARPFEGPGIEGGQVITEADGPFLVAATHAKPASGQGKAFDEHVREIQDELQAMTEEDGLVGFSLRASLVSHDRWTMTVWTSEEAMDAFVLGDAHMSALVEAPTLLEVGAFAHWEESDPDELPPSWDRALDELDDAENVYE